jgi:hypothetical protein
MHRPHRPSSSTIPVVGGCGSDHCFCRRHQALSESLGARQRDRTHQTQGGRGLGMRCGQTCDSGEAVGPPNGTAIAKTAHWLRVTVLVVEACRPAFSLQPRALQHGCLGRAALLKTSRPLSIPCLRLSAIGARVRRIRTLPHSR